MDRYAYLAGERTRLLLLFVALCFGACAKDNGVTQFLSDTANKVNSLDTRIQGSTATANVCNPAGHTPALQDPAAHLAGRTFTYLRGERAKGTITYNGSGTFDWQNEKGNKTGTGKWSANGTDWCESFDAGPHNEAVSQRCWPVINFRGALCFGVTRLLPDQGGAGSATLY